MSVEVVRLSRIGDDRLLRLSLVADQLNQNPWVPNESSLTDQVWLLSILLMEYVHIFGIDEFDDGECVEIPLVDDVCKLRRPHGETK